MVFPEPQEACFQLVDGLSAARLPGAEGLDGFEVAGPAVGGFVDAAAKAQSLPVLVFDHTFFGVKDCAVVDDQPIAKRQAHPDLQVAVVYQPCQQLGSKGCGPLTARLDAFERKVVREVIGENGFSGGTSRQGGDVVLAEEYTCDQAHLAVPDPIR